MPLRHCAWCNKPPRWDDPLRNDIQINADDSIMLQALEFIVSLWGSPKQGTMQGSCCQYCAARLRGEPLVLKRWEPGKMPPSGVDGLNSDGTCDNDQHPICGICRLACFEGECTMRMRIYAADLGLPNDVRRQVERAMMEDGGKARAVELCKPFGLPRPGVYMACPECQATYKPRILRRLHSQGLFLNQTVERMSRQAMM